jgi:cellulose synthase/poly-beta-1,6-N-acetylglucosamine synthase-like glycosyltransferase
MSNIEMVAAASFWTSVASIVYAYLGYPLTLMLFKRRASRDSRVPILPSVTVVIAAHNEVGHIAATIQNKLAQDYPAELLDVVVVSDGSADGTDESVARFVSERVALLRQEPRQGKTAALNRALAVARGDIVIFSDANSIYQPSAIRELVAAFDDPAVGYVTGTLIYSAPGQAAVGQGSGRYMQYENWLRGLESKVGSVVGVNGGIDAVRRRLYEPMAADQLPDFVLPLCVVRQGYRVVYQPAAVAHEEALAHQIDEFRMRVRVSLRALHGLWDMRGLLHPRFGLFAFQLLVHKLARYLLFVPMAAAFLCTLLLAGRPEFVVLLVLQLAFYSLAVVGWTSGGRIRFLPVFLPFYFCLLNGAAAVAVGRFLRGQRQVTWTPRKGT